jgi:pyridoxamine 5'-phosphate oxidase
MSWLEPFLRWHAALRAAGVAEPDAMVLATADADGRPSARSVLLRGVDEQGFVFFTNHESRKGLELAGNPHAALVFPWYAIRRQVTVAGTVARVDAAESDAYWATRPRGSRIAAIASPQSRVVRDRAALDALVAEVEARHPGEDVPRPAHWGGLRLAPTRVELWQGREHRLHDRIRYERSDDGSWLIERLAP